MVWQESEKRAYQWFKTNIDINAEPIGGENSTKADIYSPLYNAYIEVKDITNGARCGQFTESTIKNNPFAQAIYDGNYSSIICQNFVKHHYANKNVTHFIVIDGDEMNFYSYKDFFEKHTFEVQNPYKKRSGTRSAPKKDIPSLLALDADFFIEDNRIYCSNFEKWGQYISLENPFDYFISKQNHGELRKRSTTQNMTWHLLIKKI